MCGRIVSEETRKKIGLSHLGSKRSKEARENMSKAIRPPISKEARIKISEAAKKQWAAQKRCLVAIKPISKQRKLVIVKENLTPEQRKQIRVKRGIQMGKANLGVTRSDEVKKRIAEAHTGKKHSEETKRKISETLKRKEGGVPSQTSR
jgi:hypothetical protein